MKIRFILFVCALSACLSSCISEGYSVDNKYLLVNGTGEDVVLYLNCSFPSKNYPDSVILSPNQGYAIFNFHYHTDYPVFNPPDSVANNKIGESREYSSLAYKYQGNRYYDDSFDIGSPLNGNSYAYVSHTDYALIGNISRPREKGDYQLEVNTFTLTYIFVLTEDYITSCERVGEE